MSKKKIPAFTAIKPAALTAVTGGRRSSTSGSNNDDRIMDSLNSLENAVRDVGRNNNQPDPMSQMMPLLAMTMMNQPAAAPPPPAQPQVIYVGRGRRRC